jgi:predicted transcriptional regulator
MPVPVEKRWVDFQPHKPDINKVLGELESPVMLALWELKRGDVKSVHRHVNKTRKVAVTTVATILDRLHEKGLVKRKLVTGQGLRYEYRPSMTRKQFDGAVVRHIFRGLFETFGDTTISYLVEGFRIDDEEKLREIRGHLKKLRENSG